MSRGVVAVALVVALSPALRELAHHQLAHAWTRYAWIPAVLVGIAAVRGGPARPAPRAGAAAMAGGVGLELLGLAGGVPALGRVGAGLAAAGWLRAGGLVSRETALLALLAVPIPSRLAALPSPAAERTLRDAAAAVWGLEVDGPAVVGPGGPLALAPWHAGLPLAALGAALGLYAAGRQGFRGRTAWAAAALGALLALPLQAAAVIGPAGALVAAGRPEAARRLLEVGLPWILALTAVAAVEPRVPRGGGRP
jgi:hypothetical protein